MRHTYAGRWRRIGIGSQGLVKRPKSKILDVLVPGVDDLAQFKTGFHFQQERMVVLEVKLRDVPAKTNVHVDITCHVQASLVECISTIAVQQLCNARRRQILNLETPFKGITGCLSPLQHLNRTELEFFPPGHKDIW